MTSQSNSTFPSSLKLIQLIELARHGARSPFYDIWDARTNWSLPLQTLTVVGQRQHYLIGKELNNRYKDTIFNGGNYESSQISVVSTSSDRAQQSALSQLYGIYQRHPSKMNLSWSFNSSTDLPPMQVTQGKQTLDSFNGVNLPNSYEPINVLECKDPYILESYNVSKGYARLKAKNFLTPTYKLFDEKLLELKLDFIEKFKITDTPASDVTIVTLANYWDSIVCNIYEQIPLPDTFDKEFLEKLSYVYDFQQLYLNFNEEGKAVQDSVLLKIQTTAFFKDVIGVLTSSQPIKFKFYSASDGNLNAVLLATGASTPQLNFNEWRCQTSSKNNHSNAPFASTIFFEIYEDSTTGEKFVRMLYNDTPIKISNFAEEICSLNKEFIPFLQSMCLDQHTFDELRL